MRYPLLEQDGRCASISVEAAHGGRWKASVILERDGDFARLRDHPAPSQVPNHFPTQEAAAEAAYSFARMLINQKSTQPY